MTVKFTNNASTTIGTGINASATSLTVASASSFPSLSGADDYCYLTLQGATNTTREVVKATALSGNTFTIVRAQDNTSAASWVAGDIVELRMTAALLTDVIDAATVEGVKTNYQYTPTAGQTVFSGADNASATMIINQAALVSVYMNGVRLVQGTDYTVSSANNTVTLGIGATTADIIDIEVYGNFVGQSGAAVGITGGSITGTAITATSLGATGTATLNTLVSNNATISGGSLDGVTIGGTTRGAISGNAISGTSFASTGDMTFGDNDKAIFGAGSDLSLYHVGGNSYVLSNTGSLVLRSDSFRVLNAANSEQILHGDANGAVTAYYDNAVRLATTASGIDVTGSVTADSLIVDGAFSFSTSVDGVINSPAALYLNFDSDNNSAGEAFVIGSNRASGSGGNEHFRVDASGNVDVTGSVTMATGGSIVAGGANDLILNAGESGTPDIYLQSGGSTKVKIEGSNGNVLVGTTDSATYNFTSGGGTAIWGNGLVSAAKSGAIVGIYNRTTSDGSILDFRKDGTTVGLIGTNGGRLSIGSGDVNLNFNASANSIYPISDTTGTFSDGIVDVGASSARFKNLYLSGSANIGGNINNYVPTNSGNPEFSIGSSATNRLFVQSVYNSGAQVLNYAVFRTFTSSSTANAGRIVFAVDEADKLEINDDGIAVTAVLNVGGTAKFASWSSSGASNGIEIRSADGQILNSHTGTSLHHHQYFYNSNEVVGSISTNGSATSFNTSSDYRLKENVVAMTGATERLKQLNPSRFNFIADAETTVDGFLAHEVQDIVPEAITGTKDAMMDEEYEVTPAVLDDDGNVVTEAVMGTRSVPNYQGIDQSKLVPLLVATIQELEARIAALES